jgi:micrococcal nuclease
LISTGIQRVVGITAGDTITVLKGGKSQLKIRLAGIDAPGFGQEFGSRAKRALPGWPSARK